MVRARERRWGRAARPVIGETTSLALGAVVHAQGFNLRRYINDPSTTAQRQIARQADRGGPGIYRRVRRLPALRSE
jgi:hypothetical protein